MQRQRNTGAADRKGQVERVSRDFRLEPSPEVSVLGSNPFKWVLPCVPGWLLRQQSLRL